MPSATFPLQIPALTEFLSCLLCSLHPLCLLCGHCLLSFILQSTTDSSFLCDTDVHRKLRILEKMTNLVKDKKLFQVKQESLPVLKDSWPTLSLKMSYWPDLLGVCSTGCHGARACSHSFLIREIPPPKLLSCLLLRIFSWSWWRLLTTLLPNIVWAFCTNHLLSNFSSSKKAYQSIVLCTRFYTLSKAKR